MVYPRVYPKVRCACGLEFGTNVLRQHGRKCLAQLRAWKAAGNNVTLLDERNAKQRTREGEP